MPKKVAILIETKDHQIKPAMFGVITAAQGEDHELYALVIDGRGAEYQPALSQYGVARTINVAGGNPARGVAPDGAARTLLKVLDQLGIATLMGLTSPLSKDLLPRIAALWDAPLALDCLSVDLANGIVTKAQYSGKTIATVKLRGTHGVLGLRPNMISPKKAPTTGELVNWAEEPQPGQVKVTAVTPGTTQGVALSEADIIISGGRAMGNGENFAILEACAQALGGAVGASRVAVDSGWVPHTMQVGQTGTTVCPKLYIACGISGAVQHFAGMKTAEVIVAINADPDAPLMRGCDYGIVGDLFEIVPLLTQALQESADKPT